MSSRERQLEALLQKAIAARAEAAHERAMAQDTLREQQKDIERLKEEVDSVRKERNEALANCKTLQADLDGQAAVLEKLKDALMKSNVRTRALVEAYGRLKRELQVIEEARSATDEKAAVDETLSAMMTTIEDLTFVLLERDEKLDDEVQAASVEERKPRDNNNEQHTDRVRRDLCLTDDEEVHVSVHTIVGDTVHVTSQHLGIVPSLVQRAAALTSIVSAEVTVVPLRSIQAVYLNALWGICTVSIVQHSGVHLPAFTLISASADQVASAIQAAAAEVGNEVRVTAGRPPPET